MSSPDIHSPVPKPKGFLRRSLPVTSRVVGAAAMALGSAQTHHVEASRQVNHPPVIRTIQSSPLEQTLAETLEIQGLSTERSQEPPPLGENVSPFTTRWAAFDQQQQPTPDELVDSEGSLNPLMPLLTIMDETIEIPELGQASQILRNGVYKDSPVSIIYALKPTIDNGFSVPMLTRIYVHNDLTTSIKIIVDEDRYSNETPERNATLWINETLGIVGITQRYIDSFLENNPDASKEDLLVYLKANQWTIDSQSNAKRVRAAIKMKELNPSLDMHEEEADYDYLVKICNDDETSHLWEDYMRQKVENTKQPKG